MQVRVIRLKSAERDQTYILPKKSKYIQVDGDISGIKGYKVYITLGSLAEEKGLIVLGSPQRASLSKRRHVLMHNSGEEAAVINRHEEIAECLVCEGRVLHYTSKDDLCNPRLGGDCEWY